MKLGFPHYGREGGVRNFTKAGTSVLRRSVACSSHTAGGELNKFEVLFSRYSREPGSIRLNWSLHTVYQESNQSKIRECVNLEVVGQSHKHGDHYVIVKGHV